LCFRPREKLCKLMLIYCIPQARHLHHHHHHHLHQRSLTYVTVVGPHALAVVARAAPHHVVGVIRLRHLVVRVDDHLQAEGTLIIIIIYIYIMQSSWVLIGVLTHVDQWTSRTLNQMSMTKVRRLFIHETVTFSI